MLTSEKLLNEGYKRCKFIACDTTFMMLFSSSLYQYNVNKLNVSSYHVSRIVDGVEIFDDIDVHRISSYHGLHEHYIDVRGSNLSDKDILYLYLKFNKDAMLLSYLFHDCRCLVEIPSDLFEGMKNVLHVNSMFRFCDNLKSIPSCLFNDMVELVDASHCFSSCKSITEIPRGLFDANKNIVNFVECFSHCCELRYIPYDLFCKARKDAEFNLMFYSCPRICGFPCVSMDGKCIDANANSNYLNSLY